MHTVESHLWIGVVIVIVVQDADDGSVARPSARRRIRTVGCVGVQRVSSQNLSHVGDLIELIVLRQDWLAALQVSIAFDVGDNLSWRASVESWARDCASRNTDQSAVVHPERQLVPDLLFNVQSQRFAAAEIGRVAVLKVADVGRDAQPRVAKEKVVRAGSGIANCTMDLLGGWGKSLIGAAS